jgi:hypothetical protein
VTARIIVVSRDLMFASRIAAIAAEAGVSNERVDDPAAVIAEAMDLIVLEWDDRAPHWATTVAGWAAGRGEDRPRVIAAVSHRDIAGIREARAAGISQVVARSGLAAILRRSLGIAPHASAVR